jgi:hypothetical protein
MRVIASNYNQIPEWLLEHDYTMYDRSDNGADLSAFTYTTVPNIGSDLADKFTFIIDNYENLPDVALYTKSNIFKYITKDEFDRVKDNKTFTPILTKNHKVYDDENGPVCFYDNQGLFNEVNNYWYLYPHPAMHAPTILDIFKMRERMYNTFAPGSNYILTKDDIRRHPRSFYEKLRSFLLWDRYPGDAQLLERNLYYLWGTDLVRHE